MGFGHLLWSFQIRNRRLQRSAQLKPQSISFKRLQLPCAAHCEYNHNILEPKVIPSNVLFWLTNSQKLKNTNLAIMKRRKAANSLWHFSLILIVKMVAD